MKPLSTSCSLVEGCPIEAARAFRRAHPDYEIVSYINTSVEVKAESNILCTSRNAVQVVNSIPPEKPNLFLPDVSLGNYVRHRTRRESMKIWQATCILHATFSARRLMDAKLEHPIANGRFRGLRVRHRGVVPASDAAEFIVMTESRVRHSLQRVALDKRRQLQ